ncbi:MAG: hypothetical protein ABTQ34_05550 [Bdellovibrionales bacterium]
MSVGALQLKRLLAGIRQEEKRSDDTLHLTAYENRLSKLAQSALSSNLSFRQHEGTLEEHDATEVLIHGSFMLMGLPGVYALEREARDATQHMFHAATSDFRPTSGLHAMLCTLLAATKPGDVVYSIDPVNGGHFASRHVLTLMGRKSMYIPWSNTELTIDMDAFAKAVKLCPPQAVFFEYGTPLFNLPVQAVRSLVGEEPMLIYDASHTLGLIAGGLFQDPLREGCNILQGNMHKTFPGPQKGMIHYRDKEEGTRLSEVITAGLVSNQHAHHSIAAYITALEMREYAKPYARQIVRNAQALAANLAAYGFDLVSRNGEYTTSHQVVMRGEDMDDKCRRLFASGMSANARYAYGQRVVRFGVQEVTRRGMKEPEMERIAALIKNIILDNAPIELIRKEVLCLNQSYKNIEYSFDREFGLDQA